MIDECDKVLGNAKMRADIQDIFVKTPHHKQVMMFSATMPEEMKKDCKKFLQKESEIFIDEGKLILHGLAQFFVYINEVRPKPFRIRSFKNLLISLTLWPSTSWSYSLTESTGQRNWLNCWDRSCSTPSASTPSSNRRRESRTTIFLRPTAPVS